MSVVDQAAKATGSAAVRRVAYAVVIAVTIFSSAEIAARVQDWFRFGTHLAATPNWDRDLFVETVEGRRGRPYGRYQTWVLNEYGFRSPPIDVTPSPGVARVIVLGASETFGLYESPGGEFPAQLSRLLRDRGDFETVNGALTGLTLSTSVSYWRTWVAHFSPSIAVIYPSPLFYLADTAPRKTLPGGGGEIRQQDFVATVANVLSSVRLVQRARDLLDVPDVIQRRRDARAIERLAADKPPDWLYTTVPADRVAAVITDLTTLTTEIQESGAVPIVVTHAIRVHKPPVGEDWDWLWRARVNTPRAMPEVIADFNTDVNAALRTFARASNVPLVDAAAAMDGHGELFADLIHFNDAGAAALARLLADYIGSQEFAPYAADRRPRLTKSHAVQ